MSNKQNAKQNTTPNPAISYRIVGRKTLQGQNVPQSIFDSFKASSNSVEQLDLNPNRHLRDGTSSNHSSVERKMGPSKIERGRSDLQMGYVQTNQGILKAKTNNSSKIFDDHIPEKCEEENRIGNQQAILEQDLNSDKVVIINAKHQEKLESPFRSFINVNSQGGDHISS